MSGDIFRMDADRSARQIRALLTSQIPDDIRKAIDAEELADRVVEAERLLDRGRTTTSATLRKAHAEQAQAILSARPRQKIIEELRSLMVKVAQTTDAAERERLVAAAEEVKQRDPIAPSRRPPAVLQKAGKGGDDPLVPLYDETGTLVGLAPRSKLIPVEPISRSSVARETKRRGAR